MKRLLAAAAALAIALPAAAQSPVIVSKESERWGSFQFSLSPFSPNIDSEFQHVTYPPYATVFGSGRSIANRRVPFSTSYAATASPMPARSDPLCGKYEQWRAKPAMLPIALPSSFSVGMP